MHPISFTNKYYTFNTLFPKSDQMHTHIYTRIHTHVHAHTRTYMHTRITAQSTHTQHTARIHKYPPTEKVMGWL